MKLVDIKSIIKPKKTQFSLKHIRDKKLRKKARNVKAKYRRKHMHLKCVRCGKIYDIHVNNKSIYSKEIISKWICLFCQHRMKK